MQSSFTTDRLTLRPLHVRDAAFINALVNTAGWLEFIGDRNVRTDQDATAYIERILDNDKIHYWVVSLSDGDMPLGLITFIKRDYLEHHDIGFAFLPQYAGQGYAYEAAYPVLQQALSNHQQVVATTLKHNVRSIRLLEKLGLHYEREMEVEGTSLLIYAITQYRFSINTITAHFYKLFTNVDNRPLQLDGIYKICLPETIIIKKERDQESVFTLERFIRTREAILTSGDLTAFQEYELSEETRIESNIAQRFSRYEKTGYFQNNYFKAQGVKLFQYVHTGNGWKISAMIWEDKI